MTSEPYVTAGDVVEHLKATRRQELEMTRGHHSRVSTGVGQYRGVWCQFRSTLTNKP